MTTKPTHFRDWRSRDSGPPSARSGGLLGGAADELLRRAALRLHHLAHQMLVRFPTVDGRVQTDELVQSACERLLRALRQVTPPDTTEFFGLASLQIRRELLDLARGFRWLTCASIRTSPGRKLQGSSRPTKRQDVAAGTALA